MIAQEQLCTKYHKIQTVYLRDPATKHKTLLEGEFSKPEFEHLAQAEWVFTEKVDGMNMRVTLEDGKPRIQGRTDRAQIPPALLAAVESLFSRERLAIFGHSDGVTFYGEGFGPGIQKVGGNYRKDQGFVLFDIRIGDQWLDRSTVEDIAASIGLDVVPIIGRGNLFRMVALAREGFDSTWGGFPAEGVVARPGVELLNRRGERVITKVKCKDFPSAQEAR